MALKILRHLGHLHECSFGRTLIGALQVPHSRYETVFFADLSPRPTTSKSRTSPDPIGIPGYRRPKWPPHLGSWGAQNTRTRTALLSQHCPDDHINRQTAVAIEPTRKRATASFPSGLASGLATRVRRNLSDSAGETGGSGSPTTGRLPPSPMISDVGRDRQFARAQFATSGWRYRVVLAVESVPDRHFGDCGLLMRAQL